MAYWLLKTEPSAYSYADLERDRRTTWDGIRSPAALKLIREMEVGDLCIVYHTGRERRCVGIGSVVKAPYADPNSDDDTVLFVDVRKKRKLLRPVTLATLKSYTAFNESPLAKRGRLSVVPLTTQQWRTILTLAETEV